MQIISLDPKLAYLFKQAVLKVKKKNRLSRLVLAWRTPGTGEPGGLPSMGSPRVRHD